MDLYTLSDVGVTRSENQDNYWSAILDVDGKEEGVICLCDGMGGLQKGALASRLVVQTVKDLLLKTADTEELTPAIKGINSEIFKMSGGIKANLMGTTCTLLVCYDGKYFVLHIGDSRAYLLRDNRFTLLTEDHSAVKHFGISKKDNPDLWRKYISKLTRCIGVKDDVYFDYIEGEYQEGDKFFLCSDGCWHLFDDYELTPNMIEDLDALFRDCISNGEMDNITAGVLII